MVPDYYERLEVDPRADRAELEAALIRCQAIWSSGTRNPKTKHKFQSYLDEIPDLRHAILSDPSARASYDYQLASSKREARDRALEDLKRLVRLRSAKGGLTVSDRALLRTEAVRRGLTYEELDRLTEGIPPRPEPASVAEESRPADGEVVDAATRRQIRLTLDHLHRRDLYDALGLPRDAPTAEILARADAERKRWMQKTQVTAEKTAWLEAVAYAQSHLGQPDSRQRYDRTLALEAEESFDETLSFTLQGLSQLDTATRGVLDEEAARLGIEPDRARLIVDRYCRRHGIDRETGQPKREAPSRWVRCRSCGGITILEPTALGGECRHCRTALQWSCPQCQRTSWVDERRCPCGFSVELLEPLARLLDAADLALKSREFTAGGNHLRQALAIAPKHARARKVLDKVEQRLQEIARARAAFELERARHRLLAARSSLEAWSGLVRPDDPDLINAREQLESILKDAATLAARGRALMTTDPTAARSLFRKSLALAVDLPEAAQGLEQCPPDPPSGLGLEPQDRRVHLRWTPPPPDGLGPVTFRVLRCQGAVPTHPGDGVLLGEITGTEFDDLRVPEGEDVGYAVFSRRNEVFSLSGTTAGPVAVFPPVTDLRAEARSREVHLTWSLPASATGVRVVRKQGTVPNGPDDGTVIEALRDTVLDRSVQDDLLYHYTVFALYRSRDGRLRASRGASIAALPHRPAPIVEQLTVSRQPDGPIRLDWPPLDRGRVVVVRSSKPLGLAPGSQISPESAEAIEGQRLDALGPAHAFDPQPIQAGVTFYTPLTVTTGGLTVGRSAVYSCLPDPTDLRATRVGGSGKVHLRWRWGVQASSSLILARAGAFPTVKDTRGTLRFTVSEAEYSRLGYYPVVLPASDQGPWHISVLSSASLEDDAVVSPGLEPSARTILPGPHPEVTVSYVIRPPRFPGRPWSVTFRTDPAGHSIPPTALVAHARTVPLSVDDGEILDQFPASRDGATFRIRSRVNLGAYRLRVFSDPRSAPESHPPIRLRHPEAGGTRV